MTGPSVGFRVRHLKALLVRDGSHVARVRRGRVLHAFGVWGLEFGVWSLGFGVWRLESQVFRVCDLWFRVEGSGLGL